MSRASARASRTGSAGPLRRGRRAGDRRAVDRERDAVEVLRDRVDRDADEPDERVLGRGRVGVRVATSAG
jgi:hypothetical protein